MWNDGSNNVAGEKKTDAERHDVEMQVCAFASTSRNHREVSMHVFVRVLFLVYTYIISNRILYDQGGTCGWIK